MIPFLQWVLCDKVSLNTLLGAPLLLAGKSDVLRGVLASQTDLALDKAGQDPQALL